MKKDKEDQIERVVDAGGHSSKIRQALRRGRDNAVFEDQSTNKKIRIEGSHGDEIDAGQDRQGEEKKRKREADGHDLDDDGLWIKHRRRRGC